MARAYSEAASRRQPAAAQRSVGRSRQRGSGSAAVGLALGRAAAWGRAAAVSHAARAGVGATVCIGATACWCVCVRGT